MGIFPTETHNLAVNTDDQKTRRRAMSELQRAERVLEKAGKFQLASRV